MNNEKLAEELRGTHIEDSLWDASCRFEQLRKRAESMTAQEDLWKFEQRLDLLLEEIKDYALCLEEDE
jgi:hypothetical protein